MREGMMSTVWQTMRGRGQDLMIATVFKYAILVVGYGIYRIILQGLSAKYYFYTYVPAVGGSIAIIVAVIFVFLAGEAKGRAKRWSLIVPYWLVFSAISYYEVICVGIPKFLEGIRPIGMLSILTGIFWIFVGLRLLRKLYVINILMVVPAEGQDVGKTLVVDCGIKPSELRHLLLDREAGPARPNNINTR
jgi:hypothetical protein